MTAKSASAGPQHGQARGNARPAQPIGNQPGFGQSRYTPYPVKDPNAAERAAVARQVYRAIVNGWIQQAAAPSNAGEKRVDANAVFSSELVERLGRWSLRIQEAEDNAAKSFAGRYQALSDHLGRMSSLESGRFLRDEFERNASLKAETAELKPPRLLAEIARFFRPVDERGVDRVVTELVEFERPLNPVGVAVTPAERAEIAGHVHRSIMEEAVDRYIDSRRSGTAPRHEADIFDGPLAERLATWSDLWRQAQDDATADADARLAATRNSSTRLALAGTRFASPHAHMPTVEQHIERMTALETGRFRVEALRRAGRPPGQPLDMTRLREFVAAARFFRLEAECQLPETSARKGNVEADTSSVAVASQIYQAIQDVAARRYLAISRVGGRPPDAGLVFGSRLAERLGEWSIRWGRVQARGAGPGSRFAAVRSHLERMASLADGRALNDAFIRAGSSLTRPDALPHIHEFNTVAQFFELEARWQLDLIRSR
jgi:hypothetical protein